MITPQQSRRSFLKSSIALAGTAPLMMGLRRVRSREERRTAPGLCRHLQFSTPGCPATQVDLPPGNGRGIHLFRVDRETGAMTPAASRRWARAELPGLKRFRKPASTPAMKPIGRGADKEGTISAFAIQRADGKLELLNSVPSGGAGPTYLRHSSIETIYVSGNYFGGTVAVLPILSDGRLGAATDIKSPAGKIGPTRATNAPPGSFAFSAMTGLTRI